jgi:vitamin K-dependent gamma-carboxylase-like protein
MALGAVVLWDIILRLRDLQAFYGDQGVFSRELCLRQDLGGDVFHLFFATGSTAGLLFLFTIYAVAATCLMIGYQTRWAALLTWFFTVAVQLRNPLVLDGGDEILRVLLFWTPFLPMGARWSVDATTHKEWGSLPNSYRSVATIGVYLQFVVFYFFAALLKNGDDWLKTQDALYYALSIDQFATRLGKYLSQFPEELRILTTGALALEYLLPVLLLLPLRVPLARASFLVLAIGFHLAIAALFHFGIFMLIMVAILVVFLPPSLWDLLGRVDIQPSLPTLAHLLPLKPKFFSSTPGTSRKIPTPESTNVLRVARKAECPHALAPRPTTAVSEDIPPGYRLARPTQVFCLLICFYILFVNVYSIEHRQKLPAWAHLVARYTYEHQHWHFFAPYPFREDGYFVLEVTSLEGQVEDLFQVAPLDSEGRPVLGSARFANQRWRRWMQNLVEIDISDNREWRAATLDFFLEKWQIENPEKGWRSGRLLFVQELTPPPGQVAEYTTIELARAEGKDRGKLGPR